MLASAARTYVNRYGVLPGTTAVVVAAHDEAYRAAIDLKAAGVDVALIVDARERADGPLPNAAREAGLQIQVQSTIVGTTGRLRVNAIQVARIDSHGDVSGGSDSISCDLVVMSGGLTPSVHLFSQSRGKVEWDKSCRHLFRDRPPKRPAPWALVPGFSIWRRCWATATRWWRLRAERKGFVGALPQQPVTKQKAFVDWQHDVTTKDLKLATREGFQSIEHIKRYTTTGMATDQGKTSNLNALGVVAREINQPIPKIGLTTFRMPYTPITFGSFAGFQRGELFDPVRRTPTHSWAASHGAVFEDVGLVEACPLFPATRRRHARCGCA